MPNVSKRQFLKASVAGTAMFGLAGCTGNGDDGDDGNGNGAQPGDDDDGDEPVSLAVGTSVEGSTAFRTFTAFSQYLEDNGLDDKVAIESLVTEGATATYRGLDQGDYDVAGIASNYDQEMAPDDGDFADNPIANYDDMRQVRALLDNVNFLITEEDSGIETWQDLDGMTVSLGSPGAGTRPLYDWIAERELDGVDATVQYVEFGSQPDEMRAGRIDAAMVYVNNPPYTVMPGFHQEMDATVDWVPVPYSDSTVEALETEIPFAQPLEYDTTDDSDSYQGMVTGARLPYTCLTMSDMDDEVVHEFTRLMDEHGEDVLAADASAGYMADRDMGLGAMHPEIPVHKGAYDYYVEAGIWDDYDLMEPPEA